MHRFNCFIHKRPVFGLLLDNEIKGSFIARLALIWLSLEYEYFDPHTGARPYDDQT